MASGMPYQLDHHHDEYIRLQAYPGIQQVHGYVCHLSSQIYQLASKSWRSWLVYFSLLTFTTTIITLLACASPNFQAARPVFVEVTNSTGWSSDGLAFIFCILNSLYGYMGIDGSAHLCEEIPGPTKNVPKIMVSSRLYSKLRNSRWRNKALLGSGRSRYR